MQKGVVNVNGVPTYVCTWGGWIEDDLTNFTDIVVCVSGNPGVTGYYKDFLEVIYANLSIPVWMLSHAGHEVGKDVTIPPLSSNRDLYTLEGQVKHKIDFVKKYVPPHVNIHFVGHSIGTYMILDVMKKHPEITKQVKKAYLLFPTIQKMKTSPNGKFYTGFVQYVAPILVLLSWVFICLPILIRKTLLYGYFLLQFENMKMIRPTIKLINPRALKNVFFLAADELEKVNELDHVLIDELSDKLFFYFSTTDGWAPLSYYEDLKKSHPQVQALTTNNRHAFVLDAGNDVALSVSKWIKSDNSTIKKNILSN